MSQPGRFQDRPTSGLEPLLPSTVKADWKRCCLPPQARIRDAIQCIDQGAKGITLIVDEDQRLIGTITDGDIRRALLARTSLAEPLSSLLEAKASSAYPEPVTAPLHTAPENLLKIMQEKVLHQIPLLDADGRLAGLVTMDDLLPAEPARMRAVIMAGGQGARLMPLTAQTPKPMLEVGGRPMLEHVITQLRESGIHHVNISTHYLADQIKSHFQDGQQFGVELNYVTEDRPLGTAGSLHLLEKSAEPLLVINGDILTRLDFRAMLYFHREQRAEVTVAVRKFDLNVPYGVVETDGVSVQGLTEKPSFSFFVNAGIYLLEATAHDSIPRNLRFDMTDLIKLLLKQGRPVASFPMHEYWLDIGHPEEFEQAQADYSQAKSQS